MEYWNITGPLHNIHFNGGIRNHFETRARAVFTITVGPTFKTYAKQVPKTQ